MDDLDEGLECTCTQSAKSNNQLGEILDLLRVGRLSRGIWTGWIG